MRVALYTLPALCDSNGHKNLISVACTGGWYVLNIHLGGFGGRRIKGWGRI